MTGDEFPAYETAIWTPFSQVVEPEETARPAAHPWLLERRLEEGLADATVRKEWEKDRVVAVHRTVVLGSPRAVDQAPRASACSWTINTSFVERRHVTDRGQNAPKSRRTYRFQQGPGGP